MKDLNMNGSATFYFRNEIPYATIPKEYLRDKNLSLKAKGLLTIIYTLPELWEYNMKGLSKVTGVSIKVIRTIIKELEDNFYIFRDRKQDKKGRFYYEYIIEIESKKSLYNMTEDEFNFTTRF